jgi:hypothetical protein
MPSAAVSPTAATGGVSTAGLAASLWAVASQGAAAMPGVPGNGGRNWVAVWRLDSKQRPGHRPLTSGVRGAPRGIRTPNRQVAGAGSGTTAAVG